MTIALWYQLDAATLDGTTPYAYDAADWARDGEGMFRASLPAGIDLGVVDPLEHLLGIEGTFGPLLSQVAPGVGGRAKLTDFAIERVIFSTAGQTTGDFGTHSQDGLPDAAGVRLRITPGMMPTESAGILQGGGTGQVSTATFAAGQSGVVVLPTGMRWFASSPALAGDHGVGVWILPLYAPRDLGGAVKAGHPPAQYI